MTLWSDVTISILITSVRNRKINLWPPIYYGIFLSSLKLSKESSILIFKGNERFRNVDHHSKQYNFLCWADT